MPLLRTGMQEHSIQKTTPSSDLIQNVYMECGYRFDILVENRIVLELKAVEKLTALHEAQLLSYLKSGGWDIGFLINFNVPVRKQGVKRKVLNLHQH